MSNLKWIAMEDYLPAKRGLYLCYTPGRKNKFQIATLVTPSQSEWYVDSCVKIDSNEITAWIMLTEPWTC